MNDFILVLFIGAFMPTQLSVSKGSALTLPTFSFEYLFVLIKGALRF